MDFKTSCALLHAPRHREVGAEGARLESDGLWDLVEL